MPIEDHSFVVRLLHLYPYIALICCCLACIRKRGRIRRLLNSCPRLQLVASISGNHPNARRPRVNFASREIVGIHGISTAVPNPSNSGLRNRTTKSNSTIWKAAEEGDVEEIERHIKSGVDVNAYSPSHGTPLSVAAYNGNADVVTSLLSRCAEVNGCYDGYRETALHSAAERGHETVVLSLLEHGADVNAQVSGMSAVYIASLKGHWTIVRILSGFGADEEVSLNTTKDVFERIIKSSVYGIAVSLEPTVLHEIYEICDDLESLQYLCDGLYHVAKDQSVSSINPSRSCFSDIGSSVSFLDRIYGTCLMVLRSRLMVLQDRLNAAVVIYVAASYRQSLSLLESPNHPYLTFFEPNSPQPNLPTGNAIKSAKNPGRLRPRGITKPHLRPRRLRQVFRNSSRIREAGLHLRR
ncbi:ankyrin repeat-containing domain protein [Usnea florida]